MLAKQIGVQHLIVFINKCDTVDDEMIELVEMEIREELTSCGFDGDEIPVICGSALCELENKQPELGRDRLVELMAAVDDHIPVPVRDMNEPFLLPIENLYNIGKRALCVVKSV